MNYSLSGGATNIYERVDAKAQFYAVQRLVPTVLRPALVTPHLERYLDNPLFSARKAHYLKSILCRVLRIPSNFPQTPA